MEADEGLRDVILSAWIRRSGVQPVLKLFGIEGAASSDVLVKALAFAVEAGQQVGWPVLAPLTDRDLIADRYVANLIAADDLDGAIPWLLALSVRHLDKPIKVHDRATAAKRTAQFAASWAAVERLGEAVGSLRKMTLRGAAKANALRLRSWLDEGVEVERVMALEESGVDLDAVPPSDQPAGYRLMIALKAALAEV